MDRRTIGPFLLEEQIGIGGMGVVYRAIYPKNNKPVAVKILAPGLINDPKLLSRFEREIKILKRLDHPNIVKYYGGGTENNQRYYAMQFINGGSLQDVLKKRGRLSWEQAIHVGRQVCSALEHAHNAGIIHRDLKPANLFLSRKGRLMLGDFGIARDTEATALTAAGKTVGTYAYMAPEQINGAHPICGKTDLYALGCLMYEILVGETPFVSDNPAEMLMQHLNDDPHNVAEFAPDCPVWLDNLIDRMLAKNPEDRPYDALAVHTELGEIRDRIAEGNSVAGANTLPGGQIATQAENTQLRKALKKKKKRKRKDVPLHERT
jgi:serine/threonine protein kinase